ncbi:hypothetical protein D3C75_923720 [compost metagenome]
MHVGADRIYAPEDDQLGVYGVLRAGSEIPSHGIPVADAARGGADGALQPACPQTVEKTAVHAFCAQIAHVAIEAVGQDGFRPFLVDQRFPAGRYFMNGLLPGDRGEFPCTLGTCAF